MHHHVARHRFSDFGQYREQLRCWDTEATQISSGPLSIEFDCIDAGDMILSHLKFDRAAAVRSVGKPGWHALIVDISPKRWCGIDLPPGAFLTVRGGVETRAWSREPWESISVFIHHETLSTWDSPFAELAGWDPDPGRSIVATEPGAVGRYRAWVQAQFRLCLPDCDRDDASLLFAAVREDLRKRLLDVLSRHRCPEPVSPVQRVARYDLTLAALRMVQRETDRRISVSDLSHGLGVSERALQYAFTSVIGVSPAKYLLADRLNRARHHLVLEARSGGTVTTAAYDHQFENLSRFARQYARLFGERPSETLRAAREAFRLGRTSRTDRQHVRLSDGGIDGFGPAVAPAGGAAAI